MTQLTRVTPKPLYDADFAAWIEQQVTLMRAGKLHALDLENIAEELEGLVKSDRRALTSHLENVLLHRLKISMQPGKWTRSWDVSIENALNRIEDILEDSPSFRRQLPDLFRKAYPRAVRTAARQAGLPVDQFPGEPPFTLDEALRREE